jgi:hypothetical protein
MKARQAKLLVQLSTVLYVKIHFSQRDCAATPRYTNFCIRQRIDRDTR